MEKEIDLASFSKHRAFGSRWVCSMWWFFAVIVCQTYIAQLSASMTSLLENEPLDGVEDLPNQNKIRYGAIKGGSTFEFFKVPLHIYLRNFSLLRLKCS